MPPKKGKKADKRPYRLKVDINEGHQIYLDLIVSFRDNIAQANYFDADMNLLQLNCVPGLENDPYITYLKEKFDRESVSPPQLTSQQIHDRLAGEKQYFAEEASQLFGRSWPTYQTLIAEFTLSGQHDLARKLLADSAALASGNRATSDHHRRLLQDLETRARVPAPFNDNDEEVDGGGAADSVMEDLDPTAPSNVNEEEVDRGGASDSVMEDSEPTTSVLKTLEPNKSADEQGEQKHREKRKLDSGIEEQQAVALDLGTGEQGVPHPSASIPKKRRQIIPNSQVVVTDHTIGEQLIDSEGSTKDLYSVYNAIGSYGQECTMFAFSRPNEAKSMVDNLGALEFDPKAKGRESILLPGPLLKASKATNNQVLMVTERLTPWNIYIEKELESVQKEIKGHTVSVLTWIDKLNKVLGDINRGIIFLALHKIVFTNYRFGVFVDKHGNGRIIPHIDDFRKETTEKMQQKETESLIGLKSLFDHAIGLPFSNQSYRSVLPLELKVWFRLMDPENLVQIPFYWLIDVPLLWSRDEKVMFFFKMMSIMKMRYMILNHFSTIIPSILVHDDYAGVKDWTKTRVPDIVEIRNIFSQQPTVKRPVPRVYETYADLVSFVYAVFCHANDDRYFGETRIGWAKVVYEQLISDKFPEMYPILFEALYEAGKKMLVSTTAEMKEKCFKALLSVTLFIH